MRIKNTSYFFAIIFYCSSLTAGIDDYKFPNKEIASFSNYSTLGLIQNPNARFHPSGTLAFSWNRLNPYMRGSIVAYPFDWLEAAYHYTDINNALYSLTPEFSGDQTYKDKGFDFKVRLFKERGFLPQVAVGVRDFAGTDIFSAEYLAFSKRVGGTDLTFGIGFGSLSNNTIKNPLSIISDRFNNRAKKLSNTQGGEPNFDKLFSGEAGYFAGIEKVLETKKGVRLKIEYDGTDYTKEGFPFGGESFKFAFKPIRQPQSRFNIGLVWPYNESFHLKAAFVKGNSFNFGFSYSGFFGKKNPIIKKSDPQKEVENSNEIKYVTTNNDTFLYRASLTELGKRNFFIRGANRDKEKLTISYAQSKYNNFPIAVGRMTEVLNSISPDYIKEFELINLNAGMSMHSVLIQRDDYIKYKKDKLYPIVARSTKIQEVDLKSKKFAYNPETLFPNNFYRIGPNLRTQLGGPDGFFFGDLSLSYQSETKFSPSLSIVTQANLGITNNLKGLKLSSDSVLPHVRSDIVKYLKQSSDFNIERLHFNYFYKASPNLYTKISGGLLESMFAGIGGEVLYRPFDRNWSIGAEIWSVKQREYEMMFDFLDYETVTGHINFYYKEPISQVIFTMRGGRFLAKDSGINFDFSRQFPSGVRIGAFFSRTDISKQEFGEGSFDKGFYFHIPVDIFFSNYTSGYTGFGLRPLTRDGAAFISHSHHLWGVTEQAQAINLTRDWSDFYE